MRKKKSSKTRLTDEIVNKVGVNLMNIAQEVGLPQHTGPVKIKSKIRGETK